MFGNQRRTQEQQEDGAKDSPTNEGSCMPSEPTTRTAAKIGISFHRPLPLVDTFANPWIQCTVQQIGQQVDDHVAHYSHQHHPQYNRVILA